MRKLIATRDGATLFQTGWEVYPSAPGYESRVPKGEIMLETGEVIPCLVIQVLERGLSWNQLAEVDL